MQILFKALLKFFVISILLLNLMLFTQGNSFAQNEKTGLEDMFAIFTEEQIVVSALKGPGLFRDLRQ